MCHCEYRCEYSVALCVSGPLGSNTVNSISVAISHATSENETETMLLLVTVQTECKQKENRRDLSTASDFFHFRDIAYGYGSRLFQICFTNH